MSSYLVYILYDSVHNSVFHGQVLTPLLSRAYHTGQHILLVSFERTVQQHDQERLQQCLGAPHRIILLPRLPFLGSPSLWHSVRQLKPILTSLADYDLIARGPLAGWIALRASSKKCSSLLIQARGLLAEEYAYAHQKKFLSYLWHTWREYMLRRIEQKVYENNKATIETVSPALKDFLVEKYHTPPHAISIATADIPPVIPNDLRTAWRTQTRIELNIPADWTVYCYNGSTKAWQCPHKVISFFQEQLIYHPQSLLLILSQDTRSFVPLLAQHHISATHYRMLTVTHKNIYRYLAAADYGLLLREPSIVNWVSRPTKLLEYRAAGLKVIHNNTVALLAHDNPQPHGKDYFCS